MKKLLGIILGILLIPSVAFAVTIKKGDTLYGLFGSNWKTVAQNNGITDPTKLKIGQVINSEPVLGIYSPITGYSSRTTGFISANATTIPVVSTKDKAGNQIVLSNISSAGTVKVYMNLESGTSKEEPIVCTGITATSWTNCTRGLSFQGNSETSSTTIATTHNAGASIIITNIGQFYNQYVSVDGSQTINDVKTFASLPLVPTTTPTLLNQIASKNYVDSVVFNGAPDASTVQKGIVQIGTDAQFVAGTNTGSTGAYLTPQITSIINHKSENWNNGSPYGETLAYGDVVYVSSTGQLFKASATNTASIASIVGVAYDGGVAGTYGKILYPGSIVYSSNSATGSLIYLSDTPGKISATSGTNQKILGKGISAGSWQFSPSIDTSVFVPTVSSTPLYNSNLSITVTSTPTTSTDAASKIYVDNRTKVLSQLAISVGGAGNTNENIVVPSTTLPGGLLKSNGKLTIRIPVTNPVAENTTLTYKLYFGSTSTTLSITEPLVGGSSYLISMGFVEAYIYNNASTSLQNPLTIILTASSAESPRLLQ